MTADSLAREPGHRRAGGVLIAIVEQETAILHDGRRPWAWWLERAASHGQYGFANTLLIAAQFRFATEVRSYEEWRGRGRYVRKGEEGIRILSRGGRPHSVFDLSQTEGPTRTEGPAEHLLRVDPRLPERDAVLALAHQRAHAVLHAGQVDAAGSPGCRGIRRVEAESIAYLVLAHLGLDRGDLVFPRVRTWAGTDPRVLPPATIEMVGDRVLRAAIRIRAQLAALPPPSGPAETPATRSPHLACRSGTGQFGTGRSGPAEAPAAAPAPPPGDTGPSREELIAVHAAAHRFFLEQLAGSWAPAYLDGRGFDAGVRQEWHIGYAPKTWRALTDRLRGLGYGEDTIVASGLARRGRTGKPYDTFRDRVMLAIRAADGTVAGFIGRRPDGAAGPKYLNSPRTPLFRKSDLLFGLAETRHALAAGARPVIVEGPLDAIAVNTVGRPDHSALAPCGSVLTAAHLAAVGEVADLDRVGVLLALDGDAAGRGAAVRDWEVLAHVAGPLGVVLLPDGLDPADLMSRRGGEAVRAALRAETPLADLVVDTRMRRAGGSLEFTEQRWAAVRAAAGVIARLPPEQIGRHVARVAGVLGLEPGLITSAVMAAISPDPPGADQVAAGGGGRHRRQRGG